MLLKGFDLFSGVGGFHHAAHELLNSEYQTTIFCELDQNARKAYKAGLDEEIEYEFCDVNEITKGYASGSKIFNYSSKHINNKIPNFDILFAGFPCQPFSSMGEKKGLNDPRGNLFFHIEAILKAKKPRYFILENVRGLKNIDSGAVINYMESSLQKIGYQTTFWLLNSSDYGVPQTRRRIFIVGDLKGQNKNIKSDSPPNKIPISKRRYVSVKNILEKSVDHKYFLSERIKKTILSNGSGGYNYKSTINMDPARPLTYTMHKMHRASQDNYYDLNFINGGPKNRIRRITPFEALLLQGFKKNVARKIIKSNLSDTAMYKLAGNAVSILTAKAVLRHILK